MTKNYQKVEYDGSGLAVPDRVGVAMAETAADLEEGLLALAVGAGLQVMRPLNRPGFVETPSPRNGGVMPAPRKYPGQPRVFRTTELL